MSSRPTYGVFVDTGAATRVPGLMAHFKIRPEGRTEALSAALRRVKRDTGLNALTHHAYGYERDRNGSTTVYYNVTLGRNGEPVTAVRVVIGGFIT